MADLYRPRDDEPGPLTGLRVLDLTIARAGPTCTRQLADLGAEVIQVRGPARGDLGGSDAHNLHRGKRSLLLDLKHDAGRAVFLRLVDRADVLVENYRPAVKHRLGIDYPTLAARRPRLVYASLSAFGQDGPYRERPGVDQIVQGLSGLMSVTGPPGGGPWRAGIAISDSAAGTFLTQGILAALLVRERTGRGQWVHTSLLESLINLMDFQAVRWLVDGVVPPQAGNDHPTVFPMGTFRARDGWMNMAPMMQWEAFLEVIDARDLEDDPRFADWGSRARHREALRAAIEAKLAAGTVAEWVERLNAVGIPCGPVLAMDQVFADPQVRHLRLTRRVTHAEAGPMDLLRHPVSLTETPPGVHGPPPRSGADTRAILREHGYDDAAIDGLIAAGAAAEEAGGEGWPTA